MSATTEQAVTEDSGTAAPQQETAGVEGSGELNAGLDVINVRKRKIYKNTYFSYKILFFL